MRACPAPTHQIMRMDCTYTYTRIILYVLGARPGHAWGSAISCVPPDVCATPFFFRSGRTIIIAYRVEAEQDESCGYILALFLSYQLAKYIISLIIITLLL